MQQIGNPLESGTEPRVPVGPVLLADGSVLVPVALAGPVRRILVRDLAQHIRADGGAPTARVRELLYLLGRAEHLLDLTGSDDGTPPAVSPTVEISTDHAAQLLGCSAEYVRRLCRSGRLAGRRIGRAWLIDQVSFDSYRHGGHPHDPTRQP